MNKYNSEGYYDPTAYEALTAIEQEAKKIRAFRPVVYICSPLAGDVEGNQEKARKYCRFAVDAGYIPSSWMTRIRMSATWPCSWTPCS